MRAWIRLPSPAMGVALIALVVALSGTSYAVVRIGTKQIKTNAITSPKIRNGAVHNVDLARNSVVTAKIVAGAVTGLQIATPASATPTSETTPCPAPRCAAARSATAISPTMP